MGKTKVTPMFNIGICESSFSKRTIVTIITQLKNNINEKIYTCSNGTVTSHFFKDIQTLSGCLFLKGYEVRGISLYDYFLNYSPQRFYSDRVRNLLRMIKEIAEASLILKEKTGVFTPVILNGIYLEGDGTTITFLPSKIIDTINSYYDKEKQKALYYCMEDKRNFQTSDEHSFVLSLTKLIYLFFSKDRVSWDEPFFDMTNFIQDTPKALSDMAWDVLHGKIINLDRFKEVIVDSLFKEHKALYRNISLVRRRSFISLKYNFSHFLSNRWKLILGIILVSAIGVYLISDFLTKRNMSDFTKGLNPEQVVELYYKALDDLNIDIVDSLFYKRAGREILNELSTLFVIVRMEEAFGNKLIKPDELDRAGTELNSAKVYGIKDLEIKNTSDGENPVFHTQYIKVLSVGSEIKENYFEETIYLKRFNERWFIVKSERVLRNEGPQ